jgi:REP element-mobilizing transposase RayT
MPYARLYYHLVWATRDRRPVITPVIAAQLADVLRWKVERLGGQAFAVHAQRDHAHVVAAFPPAADLVKCIRQLKGASATRLYEMLGFSPEVGWAEEYGVVSLSADQLDAVVEYVNEQETHHAQDNLIPELEEIGTVPPPAPAEPAPQPTVPPTPVPRTPSTEKPKYFWSDELAEPAVRDLMTAFILVSVADLFATMRLLAMGVISEGNALANWVLREFGNNGFILFKLLLIALILALAAVIHARRPAVGRAVLWTGILLTGVVLIRHIAIMLAII